jgi:hypothetical protein
MDLSNKIYPIEYKGKRIIYSDWTGLDDPKKMVEVVNYTTNYILEKKEYHLLELVDVSNSYGLRDGLAAAKKAAELTKPFSKKKAIIGVNSKAKQFLLNFVNSLIGKDIVAFNSKEEALEWLAKDE